MTKNKRPLGISNPLFSRRCCRFFFDSAPLLFSSSLLSIIQMIFLPLPGGKAFSSGELALIHSKWLRCSSTAEAAIVAAL